MDKKEIAANAQVICRACGRVHRLIPAIGTPVYWCGNDLNKLEEGDEIEYEELE